MNCKNYLTVFFLFLVSVPVLNAQRLAVLAGNNQNKSITIRWFADEILIPEGVNIYRRELPIGQWTKLNNEIIKKIPKADEKLADDEMKINSTLIYGLSANKDNIESWMLVMFSKIFTDQKFAVTCGIEFTDASAEQGKSYEYKINIIENGKEVEGGISTALKVESYKAPSSPKSLTAVEGDGKAKFKWERDNDSFFAYNLYRGDSETGERKLINGHPIFVFDFDNKKGDSKPLDNFYSDTNLTNGKTYYYELAGIDFLGRISQKTAPIKVTPKDLTPPPAPVIRKVLVNKNEVTITWHEKMVNDLNEFNIYRGTESKGPFEKINKSAVAKGDTLFTDKVNDNVKVLFYYVEAKDISGNSASTSPYFVEINNSLPPAKPTGVKGTGNVGSIQIEWKKGPEKDLLGYNLYRSITGGQDEYLLMNIKPLKSNIYTDSLKKYSTNYFYYKVKAVNDNYVTSDFSEVLIVRAKDIIPPATPFLTEANLETGYVNLIWAKNTESDLKGYDVYRSTQKDSANWAKVNKALLDKTILTYRDSLSISGNYYYSVTASDSSGNISKKSNFYPIRYILIDTVLISPSGLSVSYDSQKKEASLKWDKIQKKNLTGYIVFRKKYADAVVFDPVSNTLTDNQFTDKNLQSGDYYYYIQALDNAGNISKGKIVRVEVKE